MSNASLSCVGVSCNVCALLFVLWCRSSRFSRDAIVGFCGLWVSCAWNCTCVLSRATFSGRLLVGNVFCPRGRGTLGIVRLGIVDVIGPKDAHVVVTAC